MTKRAFAVTVWSMAFVLAALVAACGGGGGGSAAPAANATNSTNSSIAGYTIGGSVTGLAAGASVVLQDNGMDNLTVTANGTFSFVTKIANGSAYSATVLTQPTGQTCAIANGNGNATANVSNVVISCTNNTNNVNNAFANRYTGTFTDNTVTSISSTGASGTVTFLRDDAACTTAGVYTANTACYRVESVAYTFTTPTLTGCTVTPATYAVSLVNTPLTGSYQSYLSIDLASTIDPASGLPVYKYLLIAGWNPPSYPTTIVCNGVSLPPGTQTPFAALASYPGTSTSGLQQINGSSIVGGSRTYTWSLNAAP